MPPKFSVHTREDINMEQRDAIVAVAHVLRKVFPGKVMDLDLTDHVLNRNALVGEFHEAMDVAEQDAPANPVLTTQIEQRIRFIAEELVELCRACNVAMTISTDPMTIEDADEIKVQHVCGEPDLVEVADALTDLDYVVTGAHRVWGLPQDALFALVHENNMSKLGPDGKPIKDATGKVQKPEGWAPPDVAGLLRAHGAAS